MTKLNYLSNAMMPGALGVQQWYRMDDTKDILVTSSIADEFDITEMHLNVTNISVFKENGQECFLSDFKGQHCVKIRGISDSSYMRTKSTSSLESGLYSRIRFYVKPEAGKFIHSDSSESNIGWREFVDFEINGFLNLSEKGHEELIIHFDFPRVKNFDTMGKLTWISQSIMDFGNKVMRQFSSSNS